MNIRERFGTLHSRLRIKFLCPYCHSNNIIKSGKRSTGKQRYLCKNCQNRFITVYNIQSLFFQHRL
ncbi:MAG: IS1 family transposase [Prevotella histicola]|uniref:IS1/IS1595 family N-terminal zinc-binding domain-containing protein n=1 Tax=Prevotella histicola TaxID=470565 RepID=UPI001CB13D1A|nr:IS1 family transposase [Prevotella histicola]